MNNDDKTGFSDRKTQVEMIPLHRNMALFFALHTNGNFEMREGSENRVPIMEMPWSRDVHIVRNFMTAGSHDRIHTGVRFLLSTVYSETASRSRLTLRQNSLLRQVSLYHTHPNLLAFDMEIITSQSLPNTKSKKPQDAFVKACFPNPFFSAILSHASFTSGPLAPLHKRDSTLHFPLIHSTLHTRRSCM